MDKFTLHVFGLFIRLELLPSEFLGHDRHHGTILLLRTSKFTEKFRFSLRPGPTAWRKKAYENMFHTPKVRQVRQRYA